MRVELRLFIAIGTGHWHNNESHWVATAAYGDFATTGVGGVPGALLFDLTKAALPGIWGGIVGANSSRNQNAKNHQQ